MSQVPAAKRTLQVLRILASQPDPVPLERMDGAEQALFQRQVHKARLEESAQLYPAATLYPR